MTMILGFGLTGWMLRRRRSIEGQAERRLASGPGASLSRDERKVSLGLLTG